MSKQIPQKNKPIAALTNLSDMLQWEKEILENEVQENKRGNRK